MFLQKLRYLFSSSKQKTNETWKKIMINYVYFQFPFAHVFGKISSPLVYQFIMLSFLHQYFYKNKESLVTFLAVDFPYTCPAARTYLLGLYILLSSWLIQ